jgi:putative DNA primase/helicase
MSDFPSITLDSAGVRAYCAARVPHLKWKRAKEQRGPCPVHKGTHDNFAVESDTGKWFCHVCGRGGDLVELEMALSGVDFKAAKAEVFRIIGRPNSSTRSNGNRANTAAWREIDRYPYTDEDGNILFYEVRYLKPDGTKTFTLVRPSGVEAAGTTDPERPVETGGIVVGLNAGEYVLDPKLTRVNGKSTWKRAEDDASNHDGAVYHFRDCPRVPYRLPNILHAEIGETIFLVEGEKDVHTLEKWGLVASCNPGGSGSGGLYSEWTEYFAGMPIAILFDNDKPGKKHALTVAWALWGVAASLCIVELSGLHEKGDVTDWRDTGGTLEQFRELVAAAEVMDAVALAELQARWESDGGEPPQAEEPHQASTAVGAIITRRFSDIEAKPVNWLWPGRIARGKLTIFAGNPGLGKSQVSTSIAATVSTGGCWPVDGTSCARGDVIILSAEDDAEDTIRPRLEAAGADLRRVHILDGVLVGLTGNGQQGCRLFNLEEDIQKLSAKLTEFGNVALMVIDPVSAYLGQTDSHRNAAVRALLAQLMVLAARHNVAIIIISHLNKNASGLNALMRIQESVAFAAAPRAAYLVEKDRENPARRLFLPMKNNIGPGSSGLAFGIQEATVESPTGPLRTPYVVWEKDPVSTTADEAMQAQVQVRGSGGPALREAEEWLRETLTKPTPVTQILDMAAGAGIAEKTLRRAFKRLGIVTEKDGHAGWTWSFPPPKDGQDGQDSQDSQLGFS